MAVDRLSMQFYSSLHPRGPHVQGIQFYLGNPGLNELRGASIKSSCAVVVSSSVAECIANFASQEGADLIAMYTHERTGLAKLLKGSVTADVKRRASVEVRAFGSSELAEIGVDLRLG